MNRCAYSNEFQANKLSNLQEVAVAADAEEEGDGIADVADDQVERQGWVVDI